MAFEIPTALIHQLQISLREEAGIGFYDPEDSSLSPPLSVEDAVAALDPDLPSSLRCERCRGGLLRGLSSPLCIYCGERRSGEGISDRISFRSTAACRWLLDSLGLDGSEPIILDTESKGSIEGRDMQKSGFVLSDLLDLELRWPSDREEVTQSSANVESASSQYALNLSGVDLDSFFTETKTDLIPSASASSSSQVIQEGSINRKSRTVSGQEDFNLSGNFQSSGRSYSSSNTKNSESGHSFANWEAEFQSATSETFAADSKSVDLFQSPSITKSDSTPNAASTIDKKTHSQLETNRKALGVELTDTVAEPLTNTNFVEDDLWPRRNTEQDKYLYVGTGSTSSELKVSSSDNWVQGDLLFSNSSKGSENAGNAHDTVESSDVWQDFSRSGEAHVGQPDLEKQTASTPRGHPSETKSMDTWPISSTNTVDNTKNTNYSESFDDWQDFAGSGQAQGSLSNITEETRDMPFEHHSETKFMEQLPIRNTQELVGAINEDDSSFDDWQDFASSGPLQGSLPNIGEETRDILERPRESKPVEQLPASNIKEFTESINEKDDSFDDWHNLASVGQAQETLSNIWKETPGMSVKHTSESESNLWPTSDIKESTESINENNNSIDDWQDFASSGQAQGSLSNPAEVVVGTPFELPPETKFIDMWPTSSIKETGESVNENSDPFDDWRDFASSGQAQEILSKPWGQTGASPFDYSSGPKQDEHQGLEFGSFMHFDASSKAPDEKKGSDEANNLLLEALTSDRTNGTNQLISADPFSAFGGSMNADHTSSAKMESSDMKIEALLSETRDLSFMLKDELSIPDKLESFKSNS